MGGGEIAGDGNPETHGPDKSHCGSLFQPIRSFCYTELSRDLQVGKLLQGTWLTFLQAGEQLHQKGAVLC